MPVPPFSLTDPGLADTAADLWGRMCHGTRTVSAPAPTVTYPSNSTVCSSGPLPPSDPPFSVQTGSFEASTFICTRNLTVPLAGSVTVLGTVSFTAPLAASSAYRKPAETGSFRVLVV